MTSEANGSTRHLLICFDGSDEAAGAIETAARLVPGAKATILYAWSSAAETAARFGAPGATWVAAEDGEADRAYANKIATKGTEIARTAGLDATPLTAHAILPAWAVILETARRLEPDTIVLGSRGLTGVRSLILGSTSHHVVNLARQPTLVIPGGHEGDPDHEREGTTVTLDTPT